VVTHTGKIHRGVSIRQLPLCTCTGGSEFERRVKFEGFRTILSLIFRVQTIDAEPPALCIAACKSNSARQNDLHVRVRHPTCKAQVAKCIISYPSSHRISSTDKLLIVKIHRGRQFLIVALNCRNEDRVDQST
jgi:hypothetical protein